MNYFSSRKVCVVTKHHKEKVIAPLLELELGLECFVGIDIDTDLFGTFSGEIERKKDPISTARDKCLAAMEFYEIDLAIASEGSFGNHPSVPFAVADDEFILLVDKRNGLEFIEREISTDTNFSVTELTNLKDLKLFSDKIGFPAHGIILKITASGLPFVKKDFQDWQALQDAFIELQEKNHLISVETDMRAMNNPTRMKVIQKATEKLIGKLKSVCPKCETPGFSVTNVQRGLPCELCSMPTQSTKSYVYSCQKCTHEKEELYPSGKETENPMYCDFCNP
jgi:hypothetical protein